MYNSDVRVNQNLPEYGKFVEIKEDSRFPAVSVTRFSHPNVANMAPVSSVDTYPKYAVLSHIVNASDINISLSASNVDIGNVGIIDHTTGTDVYAQVVRTATVGGFEVGAVRVLTQDLECDIDDITIGDRAGNLAAVNASLSALRTFTTNPISAVSITNSVTAVTVSNPVSSVSLVNPVTAVTINNAVSSFNLASSNITLPVSGSVTIISPVTSVSINNFNTVFDSVTANQTTQITLEKTLSANSVYGTLSAQPLYIRSTDSAPVNVSFGNSVQLDQNSRLRVAMPGQEWWYVSSVDKDGDLRYIETLTDGASSLFVQNLASVYMTSGTTSVSGKAVRGSRRRHKMRPGTSHMWTGTVNFLGKQNNAVKRVGMFTNFNGYFFELSGSDMSVVVRRRLIDGTLVEERVKEDNWNGDKLDGLGPSGENWSALTTSATITGYQSVTPISIPGDGTVYNVVYGLSGGQAGNFRLGTHATITGITPSTYNNTVSIAGYDTTTNRLTATYITNPGAFSSVNGGAPMSQTAYHMVHTYWIDFLGGRTNRVRFGKQSDNGPIVLHQFNFDGLLGSQYENAPALIDRKEIYNTGSVTSLPGMILAGVSFTTESESELNPCFSTAYNVAGINTTAGYDQPVIGLALRAGEPYQRGDIQVQDIELLDTANRASGGAGSKLSSIIQWKLLLNPGLSGVPASTNIGKSTRQWAYTNTTAITSAGIELMSGFVNSIAPVNVSTALNFLNLGSNLEYTDSDRIVLTGRILAAGDVSPSVMVGTLNFIEAL